MKISQCHDGTSRILEIDNGILDCHIALDRGNIFKSLKYNGHELMLMRSANYESSDRPICGCPILFPYSGNNTNQILKIGNHEYHSGIHGVVHTNKWEIESLDIEKNVVRLKTYSDEKSKTVYPFDFVLHSIVELKQNNLTYTLLVENEFEEVMPCDFGLHPFFLVSDLSNLEFSGEYVNGNKLKIEDINIEDVAKKGFLCRNIKQLVVNDKETKLKMTFSNIEGFKNILIWSGIPQQFVVIEPLSGYPNAINDHNNAFNLKKNEKAQVIFEMMFDEYESD